MKAARWKIIQAANRYAVSASPRRAAPFGMRHVQLAVSLCRRFRLVSPEVLAEAGFNPKGGR